MPRCGGLVAAAACQILVLFSIPAYFVIIRAVVVRHKGPTRAGGGEAWGHQFCRAVGGRRTLARVLTQALAPARTLISTRVS